MSPSQDPSARVQAMLGQLPEFEPDPSLRTRVASAQARHRRARTAMRAGWLGTGIAAALAVVVLRDGGRVAGVEATPLAVQRQSEALEREWLASQRGAGHVRTRARLLDIDGALQAAYDRGATADELAPLWERRNTALRSLIDEGSARTAAVTRI